MISAQKERDTVMVENMDTVTGTEKRQSDNFNTLFLMLLVS